MARRDFNELLVTAVLKTTKKVRRRANDHVIVEVKFPNVGKRDVGLSARSRARLGPALREQGLDRPPSPRTRTGQTATGAVSTARIDLPLRRFTTIK